MHVFLHFKSFCLVILKLILASKLSELEQFENQAANGLFTNKIDFYWQMAASSGKMQERRPPLKFNFTARTTSTYSYPPFLNLINGICFFFCLISTPFMVARMLAGNLQPDFQIAVTHSILKLKSISISPNKMT